MEATLVPATFFPSLGDYQEQPTPEEMEEMMRKASFNMNGGKAMESLRNDLPLVFASSNLDFSIFFARTRRFPEISRRAARAQISRRISGNPRLGQGLSCFR